MSPAHGGKTENMKDIPKCVDCTHEWAGTGRGAAAASTGGRHGREGRGTRYEERASSDGSPLCVNTSTKQRSLSKAPILLWERRIGGGLVLDFPSLADDHNRTSTPRTRLSGHKDIEKCREKVPWMPCNHEAFHRRVGRTQVERRLSGREVADTTRRLIS